MENNLSCNDIKILISPYFDNELSSKESKIVENHLINCFICALELEKIKKLSEILKDFAVRTEFSQPDLSSIVLNRVYDRNKITCNEVLEKVSAYDDNELVLRLHYEIKEHLENCSSCKFKYNESPEFNSGAT